jgi:hypothetical protein
MFMNRQYATLIAVYALACGLFQYASAASSHVRETGNSQTGAASSRCRSRAGSLTDQDSLSGKTDNIWGQSPAV